jgi:ribosome-associated heat shock protein Hsp15
MDSSVRLDKWLWAARFFKTRSVARDAVSGGKVHLNGNRAKPGRTLSVDDVLRIQRGDDEYTITIIELASRRGPAAVAQTLYEESDESRVKREKLVEQRKLEHEQHAGRERRPDKRQRRRLVRFKTGLD